MGLAMLEGTGFFSAFMRRFLLNAPKGSFTFILVLISVNSSVASDAGFLVMPPLAGMIFLASGRNPIAGMIAAYGAVAAGFSSNFLISIIEVVGFGLTEMAARMIAPDIVVPITSNYYITLIYALTLPVAAFFVTLKNEQIDIAEIPKAVLLYAYTALDICGGH